MFEEGKLATKVDTTECGIVTLYLLTRNPTSWDVQLTYAILINNQKATRGAWLVVLKLLKTLVLYVQSFAGGTEDRECYQS